MGICPTGGQANNILRYEDFDTGGMCAKPFESEGAVPDPTLDEEHGIGVEHHPDIEEDISVLQATTDADHTHIIDEVIPGSVEQGDAQHGHDIDVQQVHVPVQDGNHRGGDNEPPTQAPADEGGGAAVFHLFDVQHNEGGGEAAPIPDESGPEAMKSMMIKINCPREVPVEVTTVHVDRGDAQVHAHSDGEGGGGPHIQAPADVSEAADKVPHVDQDEDGGDGQVNHGDWRSSHSTRTQWCCSCPCPP